MQGPGKPVGSTGDGAVGRAVDLTIGCARDDLTMGADALGALNHAGQRQGVVIHHQAVHAFSSGRGWYGQVAALSAANGPRRRLAVVRAPCAGTTTTALRLIASDSGCAALMSSSWKSVRSTIRASSVATGAPIQRRMPPPNGI